MIKLYDYIVSRRPRKLKKFLTSYKLWDAFYRLKDKGYIHRVNGRWEIVPVGGKYEALKLRLELNSFALPQHYITTMTGYVPKDNRNYEYWREQEARHVVIDSKEYRFICRMMRFFIGLDPNEPVELGKTYDGPAGVLVTERIDRDGFVGRMTVGTVWTMVAKW